MDLDAFEQLPQAKGKQPEIPSFLIELRRITAKPLDSLTKDDRAFIRARQFYLHPEQVEVYQYILKKTIKK